MAVLAFRYVAEDGTTELAGAVSVITAILTASLWLYTNRLPKNPKGKVGIAIALLTDDQAEARQIEFDFLRVLRDQLQRDPALASSHPETGVFKPVFY